MNLTVTVEFAGDTPELAAVKVGELLPDRNGIFAAGIASVIVRRLCAMGLIGGYPVAWHIQSVEVDQ